MNKTEIQEIIKSHFPTLNRDSVIILSKYASFLNLKKRTELISERKRHHSFYLILKGSAKAYYTKESKEVCSWFAFENEIVANIITEHAVFLEEKLYQLQFMSSEERYKALINVAPEILQKVSLTDIASYLGVSRETLSRIRGKK